MSKFAWLSACRDSDTGILIAQNVSLRYLPLEGFYLEVRHDTLASKKIHLGRRIKSISPTTISFGTTTDLIDFHQTELVAVADNSISSFAFHQASNIPSFIKVLVAERECVCPVNGRTPIMSCIGNINSPLISLATLYKEIQADLQQVRELVDKYLETLSKPESIDLILDLQKLTGPYCLHAGIHLEMKHNYKPIHPTMYPYLGSLFIDGYFLK